MPCCISVFKKSQSAVRFSTQWIRDFLSLLYNWVYITFESMPSSKTKNNIVITTQVWDWITTASLGKMRDHTNPDAEVSVDIKLWRYSRSRMINCMFVTEHKHKSKAERYRLTTNSNTPGRCSVFHFRRLIV